MKRIEDIEKLSLEELERSAEGVTVPEGLRPRLEAALAAAEAQSRKDEERSGKRWIPYASLAAAAALVAAIVIPATRQPKDSFDDPLLAYAKVEETFRYISDKMSEGVNQVREARPAAEMPGKTIKKINSK